MMDQHLRRHKSDGAEDLRAKGDAGAASNRETDTKAPRRFELGEVMAQFGSGATAGLLADVIIHPVDTVRTRLWMQGTVTGTAYNYTGVTHAVTSILRQEGIPALYKGFGSVVLLTPLANGLYFMAYEFVKQELEQDDKGPRYFGVSPTYSPIVAAGLGKSIC